MKKRPILQDNIPRLSPAVTLRKGGTQCSVLILERLRKNVTDTGNGGRIRICNELEGNRGLPSTVRSLRRMSPESEPLFFDIGVVGHVFPPFLRRS